MSQTSKVIGQHFSKLRRDYALTQEAFAKRIGVNTSYIGPLERGEKIPSLTMLERVASEFSVPLFTFFINAELEDREAVERIRILVGSRPQEEREFLLKTVEEMVKLLRRKPRKQSLTKAP
jgi:transcriptional regulator with XRE-family HTH domain